MSKPSPYLDYLDKEMTIMGLLSAFCVGTPALVLDRVSGATGVLADFWNAGPKYWLAGAACMLMAAFLFYRQRSLLAWYYGQLALAETGKAPWTDKQDVLLRDADSWATWLNYRVGFCSLGAAAWIHGAVLLRGLRNPAPDWGDFWTLWFPLAAAAVTALFQWFVLTRYALSEEPWKELRSWMKENSLSNPRD